MRVRMDFIRSSAHWRSMHAQLRSACKQTVTEASGNHLLRNHLFDAAYPLLTCWRCELFNAPYLNSHAGTAGELGGRLAIIIMLTRCRSVSQCIARHETSFSHPSDLSVCASSSTINCSVNQAHANRDCFPTFVRTCAHCVFIRCFIGAPPPICFAPYGFDISAARKLFICGTEHRALGLQD